MDRISAAIKIGGPVKRSLIPELVKAIIKQSICADYGEGYIDAFKEESILQFVKDGRLYFCDDVADAGEFDVLESFLEENHIAFIRQTEGYCEYPPEVKYLLGDMKEAETRVTNSEGVFLVDTKEMSEIKKIIADTYKVTYDAEEDADNLQSAIGQISEIIERVFPDIPEFTPFEIVD